MEGYTYFIYCTKNLFGSWSIRLLYTLYTMYILWFGSRTKILVILYYEIHTFIVLVGGGAVEVILEWAWNILSSSCR